MKSAIKFGLIFAVICLVSGIARAQTKSFEDARIEITKFKNPELFSVAYERDLTTVKLSFDLREDNKSLRKPFKEFVFELSSVYSGPSIDHKPIRSLVCIRTRSKKFYFSSNRDLTFFADSKILRFFEGERSTELRKRKARENLCWEMDKEALGIVSKSGVISFQVGSQKVSIPAGKSILFGNYAQLLNTKGK